MTTFALIPGAGGAAWYWHLVVPELQARGHRALPVDLPGADEHAGLPEYADAVVETIADRRDVVLVAQSLGAFTAPLVCQQIPVRLLVLLNAMVPAPDETPGDWWENTGSSQARVAAAEAGGYSTEFDLDTYFLHDVPMAVQAEGAPHQRPEADIIFGQSCTFDSWPNIPIRVLIGRDDRFFPAEFQRRIARERLGIDADEMPGGHLAALSYPGQVAERLDGYAASLTR